MLLYEAPADEFVADAGQDAFALRLAERFKSLGGPTPSRGEVTAWRNSLRAFAHCMAEAEVPEAHVLVEYRLPVSSSRLDCLVLGQAEDGTPNGLVVELKQWEVAERSPFDECVYVYGEHRLHPSAQVGAYTEYLRDCVTAFHSRIALAGCAYLHNLRDVEMSPLGHPSFDALRSAYPVYDERTLPALVERLRVLFGGGNGRTLGLAVAQSDYRPSPKLLDHAARMVKGAHVYVLLDEQRLAYNAIRSAVERRLDGEKKAVFVVEGGPGTGKSVIAMNLVADMASKGYVVNHATGSKAFTTNVRARVGSRSAALFKYFSSYATAAPDGIDLLVCDEAHRIRATSNGRYTPKAKRSTRSQVEEIIAAGRVSAFFVDTNQVVRPGEVGTPDFIRESARAMGIEPHTIRLDGQFRCAGSRAFIEWVEHVMGLRPERNLGWREANEFDFRIFDSPQEMENALRARVKEGERARMVAGYCWPWERKPGLDLPLEIDIQGWRKAWNPAELGGTPATDAYTYWATEPGGFEQIGCIYSAQGLEWDYVGVILGPDLVKRSGEWKAQPHASHDTSVRSAPNLGQLLANTYRVLLTRGMRGCYVYCTDPETRRHLETSLGDVAIAGANPNT